jgi:hypothetical protein
MKTRKLPWHRWVIVATPTRSKHIPSLAMSDAANAAPDYYTFKVFADDAAATYNKLMGDLARFEVQRIDKD